MFCSQKISQFLKESYFKVVVLLFLYHPELFRYHKPVQRSYLNISLTTGGRCMKSTANRPDALPALPPWPPPPPSARGRLDPRVRPTNASRQSWERGSATTASTTTCKLSSIQLFELMFFSSVDSTLSKDKCLQAIAMQMAIVLDIKSEKVFVAKLICLDYSMDIIKFSWVLCSSVKNVLKHIITTF